MTETTDNFKTNEIRETSFVENTTSTDKGRKSVSDTTTQKFIPKNIPEEVLNELIAQFSINKELNSDEELLLHISKIQKAFYQYYDTHVFVKTKKHCNTGDFRNFVKMIFQIVPFLRKHEQRFDKMFSKWRQYMKNIPRYGALILSNNGTHVLMVKSVQNKFNSWGFPRGKVELGEDPVNCAVREVYEEIGFDIRKHINRDLYVENTHDHKFLRLYIIPNIPKDTKFEITSPMEIERWQWFKISQLSKNGTKPLVSLSCKYIIGDILKYFGKSKSKQMQTIATNLQKVEEKNFPPIFNFPPPSNFSSRNFPPFNPNLSSFLPNNGPPRIFSPHHGFSGNLPPSNFVREQISGRNNFRPNIRPLGGIHHNFRPNFNIPEQNRPPNNMQPQSLPFNLRPQNVMHFGIPPSRTSQPLLPTPNIPPCGMNSYGIMPPQRFLQRQFRPNCGPKRKF